MSSAREKILATLRAKDRVVSQPPAFRSRRQFDDLADRFTTALTNVKGQVLRADSLAEATDRLAECLEGLNAEKIVVNDETPLNTLNLPERWPNLNWHTVGQSEGDLRDFCVAADVGLSSADVALAETGSIVVSSGPGRSRLATLLPTVHVAMVPTSRLTSDLFTWTADRIGNAPTTDGTSPSNMVIVSGPSKTADIEQTLAVGVHGPKQFIVILYQD